MQQTDYDVLVIGAGLGGTALALHLADAGCSVGLLAKRPSEQSSSSWAQGGIAAAMSDEDSPESHAEDTLSAGGGLCHRDTVELVTSRGPDCVRWLQQCGVEFTLQDDGELHLTHEGGHSHRRVVHAADATGQAVMRKSSFSNTGAANRSRMR